MKHHPPFYLPAALLAALMLPGCRTATAPRADPLLAKYAPAASETHCILHWGRNTFKLHPDRKYALFNGTPVQLPAPAAYGENRCYRVTPGTLRNIIDPLMTGVIPVCRVRKILIDPGHGAHDNGASGKISREKELNLLLALEIRSALEEAGFQTVMSRDKDIFLPLPDRVKLVKKHGADLFISVHHNSSRKNPGAAGIECFAHRTPRPGDTLLAALVQEQLIRRTGAVNRGVKFANLAVLRNNPVPAILIEAGFISNADEERRLNDPRWRQAAARAVADGVALFVRRAQNGAGNAPRP